MRVVFMGTPDFSVPALEKIAKVHNVVGVVTQQDKPKGRGHKMTFTPVKEKAVELGLSIFQPEKVGTIEFVEVLKQLNPDVIVVIAFGQLLPKAILELPKFGCINVHASLLPKYRGAAPIQWAVIDGEKESGVTTMYMAEGLDTGDMIDKAIVSIEADETGGSLFDKLAKIGADLILQTLEKLENGTVIRTPQDDSKSTYAGKITKELGNIDFHKSAKEIERLIRGLNPWPSAYTKLDGKVMKIWRAEVINAEKASDTEVINAEEASDTEVINAEKKADTQRTSDTQKIPDIEENFNAVPKITPGTILETGKDGMKVATGKGILNILELQLEGKKRMDIGAFLNGYEISSKILGD